MPVERLLGICASASNTIVMTVALYVVLFFLSRGVPPQIQRAWDAPAVDPALLKVGLVETNFLGLFDLYHPRLMHHDLHRPES